MDTTTDDVVRRIAKLRHRKQELTRRHEQAVEQHALFPNPVIARRIEELTLELGQVNDDLYKVGIQI